MMNNNMNRGNINLSAGDKIKLVKPIGPLGEQFVGDVYEITKYENGIYWFECPYGHGCFTPNEFDAHFEVANENESNECADMWHGLVEAYRQMIEHGDCLYGEDESDYDCEDEPCCDCHCGCGCEHTEIPDSDGKLYMDDDGDFEFELDDSIPEYIENILDDSEIKCSTEFDCCAIVTCKLPNGYILVEHSAISNPADYDYTTEVKVCMDKIVNKLMGLEAYRDMWDCMAMDTPEIEVEIEDEIEVDIDDIDIEKLHKSIQDIKKKRSMEEFDKKVADLYENEVKKYDEHIKKMRNGFCMNPWW